MKLIEVWYCRKCGTFDALRPRTKAGLDQFMKDHVILRPEHRSYESTQISQMMFDVLELDQIKRKKIWDEIERRQDAKKEKKN